jgi:hypothetical protein
MLVWTYGRGTLQYDIICALILAFIFFVPRSCFHAKKDTASHTRIQSGESTGKAQPAKDPKSAKGLD